MKIMAKFTFGVFAFLFTLSIHAQTPQERQEIISKYDIELLNQMQAEAEVDYQRKRKNALALAEINNWPESYKTENGGFALLVDVIDGRPIYLQTSNAGAALTARADRLYPGGSLGLNLQGQNMLVGVWDGLAVRETHQLLEGRAEQIDGETDETNHATHVTGTIIGSGAFQSGDAQGMAPLAETVNYDFGNDISKVINANITYGLLVSNHSYGINAAQANSWYLGYYDSKAQAFDDIQYTTPYYLPVFAAGNDRNENHPNPGDGGYDILTGTSVAKNNLVVAACQQVSNYTGPGSVTMSQFSSWGPTDDGRIKPDITAKGVNTYSSTATTDTSYGSSSGTSMAAPSVAGVCALLQEHYNNI
ncbi:MAG: S8 family serine peptidase, partial [Flavobacteriaceae bacterium]